MSIRRISRRIPVIAGLAFAAGFAAAHGPSIAMGQSPAPVPSGIAMPAAYVVDLAKLNPQGTPLPTARTQDISVAPVATVTYVVGTFPAHYHATANEIQYVISGRGTELFGSERKQIQPGTLFVIPPGTVHSGMILDRRYGPLKLLVIKAPQQQPNDNHFVTPPPAHAH
jgi:mannose-6-phosphate isomerase-like protein (cupin superfamily)